MTKLTESATYSPTIFRLETTTPVAGGAVVLDGNDDPVQGHANAQAQLLANRTKYLKGITDTLGTAAVANVTTSTTDTTAGRVLKVGDFGLGAADVPALADLNTLVATGLWAFTASTLNIPPAPATGGTVMVLGRTAGGGSAGTQLAVTSNSNRTFTRSQAGGWNPWVEVWTTGNLVKTTSATDTTVGSMLKVGDFGLATDAVAAADANLITTSGFYRLDGGAGINGPLPGIFFTILSYRYGATSGGQIATRLGDTSGLTWVRGQQTGVWGAWQQVATSATGLSINLDTGSFGYGTGAGGTVTQATSKSTTVTLNKPAGRVTLAGDSLAAGASVTFQVNNTKISAGDCVVISSIIGSGAGNYRFEAWGVGVGFFNIRVTNISTGALSETPSFNFSIIKGAIA